MIPVTAMAAVLRRLGKYSASVHNMPRAAANNAPIAIARTNGTFLSLRIIVKFIASVIATPRPKIAPSRVSALSTILESAWSKTDIPMPIITSTVVTSVRFERVSPKIIREKIAANIGTVATATKTTATGAIAIARLNNVALNIWHKTIVRKLAVRTFGTWRSTRQINSVHIKK